MITKIKKLIKSDVTLIGIVLVCISLFAYVMYFPAHFNLAYGDAQSRLNISRKIIDNLTPGLAQLGNIWLPLPQLLMLPFIWFKPFWQSGFAGLFVSSISFVMGGVYLFKTMKLYGLKMRWALVALSVYATNINIIYFQTTAMSESMFIAATCGAIYYFTVWIKTRNRFILPRAGLFVGAMTLIRYEGLAVLFASYLMVFLMSFIANKNFKRAEADTVIYATLATLGFLLWTIYLAAIFGDPLYWKNYYGATQVVAGKEIYAINITVWSAITKYFATTIWMNGLMPVLLAVVGFVYSAYLIFKRKLYQYVPIFLVCTIFVFMVLTLQRNTPIGQPEFTIKNLFEDKISYSGEFNIRYGLLMMPVVTMFIASLLVSKKPILKILVLVFLIVQYGSYFKKYSFLYRIPAVITTENRQQDAVVSYMKDNYDGGLIMISALKNDPRMLAMGFDYKNYIHEGTGKYWKESIKHPETYARWIVMDKSNIEDQVTKYLIESSQVSKYFNLEKSFGAVQIYKKK